MVVGDVYKEGREGGRWAGTERNGGEESLDRGFGWLCGRWWSIWE